MSKYILPCFLFFVFCLSSLVSAGIIRVPQDQLTIQDGINAAVNGDTVLVADNTYYENINFNGKAITVASYMIMDNDSTHRDNTIINGSQPTNPNIGSVVSFVSGEDTNSVIYGFTITGGTGTLYGSNPRVGGGIHCGNSGGRISHNKIISNSVTNDQICNGGGIGHYPLTNLKHVIIEHNIIESNTVNSLVGSSGGATGGGIFLTQGRIIHNKISLNTSNGMTRAFGGGIIAICDTTSGRTFVKIVENTITNNQATSTNGNAAGGGIDVQRSNVEIVGNQISYNKTGGVVHGGSGIRINRSKEISMVNDNIISFNSPLTGGGLGGGLELEFTTGMTVQGNQFIQNTGPLGTLRLLQTYGTTVHQNYFINNAADYNGGGIEEEQSVGNIYSGNTFEGNTALNGGGIFLYDTSPEISNNLITNNNAGLDGGGIDAFDETSQPQIINNTIVANTAGLYGGGICIYSDSAIVMNTILWGNSALNDEQIYTGSANAQVVYCDIQDTIWGPSNIDADPLFADTTFQLSDYSPCIGAGIDSIEIGGTWYRCPQYCFLGNPRPNPPGSMPDIGACESPLAHPLGIEPLPLETFPRTYSLSQNYPNPFNPTTTIEFSLPHTEFVTLNIYNTLGEKVATLVSENLPAGSYKYEWDATGLASGVYLYRLEADNFVDTKKLILMR